jgi:cytochrome P450
MPMHAHREDPTKPAWSSDYLDSPHPPEIEAPYFDSALGAWVFSHYADIAAALRAPTLAPAGPDAARDPEPMKDSLHQKMRTETLDALSPAQLRTWREAWTPEVQAILHALPTGESVDLLEEYARPLCLSLAAKATGISLPEASRLYESAQQISAASEEPYDALLGLRARTAERQMDGCFHARAVALRDSGFVALSQTMPAILGNAWLALLQYPQQWRLLHEQPNLMDQALEELLRYAGPVRILFRKATQDTDVNGSLIRKGERVILRLIAANHDLAHFANANELNIARPGVGHLSLGIGAHACVGASLIRMVATKITRPLLERFAAANLTHPVEWRGGTGFRSPTSLHIHLSEV